MSRFYDVDIWSSDDEDGGALWWHAEGGPAHDLSDGVEFEPTQDLAGLVGEVHDETIQYRRRWPDLQVRWLKDRQPATEFLAAARAAGITLP